MKMFYTQCHTVELMNHIEFIHRVIYTGRTESDNMYVLIPSDQELLFLKLHNIHLLEMFRKGNKILITTIYDYEIIHTAREEIQISTRLLITRFQNHPK